jgi:hypothetical protein
MIGQLCGSPLKATQGTIDYDPTGKVRYQHQARLEQGNKQPGLQTTTIYWSMYSGESSRVFKRRCKGSLHDLALLNFR